MPPETNPLSQDVLIRAADVRTRLGNISDMTLHRWTATRGFPKSIKLGGRDRFWRKAEVDAWISSRGATRTGADDLADFNRRRFHRKKGESKPNYMDHDAALAFMEANRRDE
jgi:predicted DNA-binding transcriptional regulator AlpA